MLTSNQMQIHEKSALKFLGFIAEDLTSLNRVVIRDETWIHHYDPLTKWENEHWKRKNEPQEKKVQQQKSVGKVMLTVFFDHWGSPYQHFMPPKMTVNKEYYFEVLKILQQHVNWKRLELKNWWILHQDNAC